MPPLKTTLIMLPLLAVVSACTQTPVVAVETARSNQAALLFHNDPVQDGPVLDQVAALSASADALKQSSMLRGAAAGAALGCGLAVISSSTARRCVTQAVVGGAVGAAVGYQAGQRAVEERIAFVEEARVARDLQAAEGQFRQVRTSLPTVLAEQEAELNRLMMQRARNEITQDEHDLAVLKIEAERLELAEALEMSARDARQAARNLRAATSRGQTGLDWHIDTATGLANDVESARASFDLL